MYRVHKFASTCSLRDDFLMFYYVYKYTINANGQSMKITSCIVKFVSLNIFNMI